MTEEPDNIVLIYLRRLDEKVDRLIDEVRDLKVRMMNVEEGLAVVHRRLDRVEDRMEQVEHRLDRIDGPPQAAE